MSGSSPDIGPLDIDPPAFDSQAEGAFRADGSDRRFGSLDCAQLIREHQAGVWRYLRALGAEAPLAEDLTQETFLAVLRKPFQHYHPAATASYLRKVAHNLFVTHCRRNQQTVSLAELDRIEIDWSRWTKEDNGEDLILALRDCLQTVSPRAQLALQMRFHDRASRNEIAEALQLTPDGAKNLMQRAKKALRDCIEHKMQ
jgi:RNA polymerase sigma-70 factor (ECF subfamily)